MKRVTVIVVCLILSQSVWGQVVLRNDFVIHHKKRKLENRGITHITFNLGSRNSWNLNAYGQPVKGLTIDITALQARRDFSYREIIEKMYQPRAVFRQAYTPIPLFLLLEPPRVRMRGR